MKAMRWASARGGRRYGALLDGGQLTVVCVEGGAVVATDRFARSTPVEALSAWLAERRPKGPVTVSLVAPSEETAEVPLGADIPREALREVIRERVAGHFARDAGPFAVVARLGEHEGGVLARVSAVPQRLVEGLWRVAKPNVRFTLPAMTYTTDGLHLAICETSADLYLVEGGQVRQAVALAAGGRRVNGEAGGGDLFDYADRVAEEVVQARNSWLRRRLQVAFDNVAVSGPSVPRAELARAFEQRGIRVSVDSVTEQLPDTGGQPDEHERQLLDLALPLAAAVVDAGPVGYLDDGTRGRRSRITTPGEPVVIDARLRRALPIVTVVGVLAVAAAAVLPTLQGRQVLDAARAQHAMALEQEARYRGSIALYQYSEHLQVAVSSHQGLKWGTIVPALLATVPPGISLSNLTLSAQGATVKVSAQATASQPSLIPRWLSTLERQDLNPQVAGVTAARGSGSTFTATFTIPGSYR